MNASIPGKYGFRKRSEQRQDALELVWRLTEHLVKAELEQSASSAPPSCVDEIDWAKVPPGLNPADGDLDEERAGRKRDQIASLAGYCLASKAMATAGAHVVEFGSGSGHLGILLAYLRPDANVVLVEKQSYGCGLARRRLEALGIPNCEVFEGTVDDFANTGRPFDLAVGLHTCGLLADAVLNLAVSRGAAYCVCPCCYGQVAMQIDDHDRGQGTSAGMHPCSRVFRAALTGSGVFEAIGGSSSSRWGPTGKKTTGGYAAAAALPAAAEAASAEQADAPSTDERFIVGVCGDGNQAPSDPRISSTSPGLAAFSWCAKSADFVAGKGGRIDTDGHGFRTALRCMQTLDADRIAWAKEKGYTGALSVLEPLGCSPKCSVVRLEPAPKPPRT